MILAGDKKRFSVREEGGRKSEVLTDLAHAVTETLLEMMARRCFDIMTDCSLFAGPRPRARSMSKR